MNKHQEIIKHFLDEKNIFITGAGGTGKTYIIKELYDLAIKNDKKINVTALTGVAAILLDCNATTIHSWSGIGLANRDNINIINKIVKSKFYRYNWENIDILIIDEVSMMSGRIFELLNKIGQTIRCNKRPFGGIQIIFSGDFFQLPPVNDDIFCFETDNFFNTFDLIINLTKIHRQSDNVYKRLLLNMRKGLISKTNIELLNSKIIDKNFDLENVNIPRLVPTKVKASQINDYFIDRIKSKKYIYKTVYKEKLDTLSKNEKLKLDLMSESEKENEYELIKKSTLSKDNLILKKGAFVMSITNLDLSLGIANGTTGIIVDFTDEHLPIVEFNGKKITINKKEWKSENVPGISIYQIPLILAWGITIHKAQGLTLDKAIIDIGNDIFEAGQMYVALSRIKTLDGVYLKEFDINNLKINKNVLNFYKQL